VKPSVPHVSRETSELGRKSDAVRFAKNGIGLY
jgi:hypothetical protein